MPCGDIQGSYITGRWKDSVSIACWPYKGYSLPTSASVYLGIPLIGFELNTMVNLSIELLAVFALAFAGTNALSERQFLNQTYDYIIVGGGTSGLTVANRLTANGKRTYTVPQLLKTVTIIFHDTLTNRLTQVPSLSSNTANSTTTHPFSFPQIR